MLQIFLEQIKPLNDTLGETLDMKTIEVRSEDRLRMIPVLVTIKSAKGKKVTLPSTQLRFYRAIGLAI